MPDPKIIRLVSTQGTTRELEMDDGSIIERSGGTVSWRNNNPGNLKFEHAGSADTTVTNPRTREQALASAQGRYQGVIDLDQWGNAIFESYEAGRAAKIQLLTKQHGDHTVEALLPSYSRADYSGQTRHAEQAAAIFAEGDRQGVDLRNRTVGQMSTAEREALADGIRRFEGWRAGEVEVTRAATQQPAVTTQAVSPAVPGTNASAATPTPVATAHAATGNAAILEAAQQHFFNEGRLYEYGRPDHPRPGRDSSRLERDADGDGRLGVDCSAFVWRGLKNAGYDVPGENAAAFTTSTLFNGTRPTAYARENFDTISAADARKPGGNLQPGDLLMFSAPGGQHIGIFKGYNTEGHIQFIGSQGSTGPAEVTIRPGGYWDGGGTTIVGALRAKPEFQVRAPTHSDEAPSQEARGASASVVSPRADQNERVLRDGARGNDVIALQQQLNQLGVRDADGRKLVEDGKFGDNTREAVLAYQKANGLEQDGIVGRATHGSLDEKLGQKTATREATPSQPILLDDSKHPNNPLYGAIRGQLPTPFSNDAAAAVTAQAVKAGIDSPDKLQGVVVKDNTAFVIGNTPGFRAAVDLPNRSRPRSRAAPSCWQPIASPSNRTRSSRLPWAVAE